MKNKFFYIFTAAFVFSVPTFAMDDEEPTNSSSNPALLIYGEQKGHDIFQSRSKEIIEKLKIGFSFYRNHPALRREDTLQKMIRTVANFRKEIARETNSVRSDDYGIFRLESDIEHTTTPLFPPQYAAMEHHIRQSILEHLREEKGDQWIEKGNSRYRVRELESKNWPVCVTHEEMGVYKSVLQALRSPEEEEKQAVNKVLDQNHLANFLYNGNIAQWSDDCVTFQDQLIEICRAEVPDPTLPHTPRMLRVNFEVIPPCPLAQVKVLDPSQIRMLRIDIEHRLGDTYVPGYGFMGMKLGSDTPLMICHPAKVYLPHWALEYEKRLHEAILATSENPDDVRDKVGLFQKSFTITMALLRGSAAAGQWLAEGLYKSHGYDSILDTTEVPSVDNLSYMYWTEEEFLEKHRKLVKLIPHATSSSHGART